MAGKKLIALPCRVLIYLSIPWLILGCVGEKQGVIFDTFKLGIARSNALIDQVPLNSQYRYLKVETNGQAALLVLGYVDYQARSHDVKASSEVWYSAFNETIEIQGGRLVNTAGLDLNWTDVDLSDAPALDKVLKLYQASHNKRASPMRYKRTRTVMPGYHINIHETVIVQALSEPPKEVPIQLKDPALYGNLGWVQETVLIPPLSQNSSIQALRAIYAIDTKTSEVIYGKQYLAPDFFVSWLSWPHPKASASLGNVSSSSSQ